MIDDEPDVTFTIKTALEDTGLFEVDVFNDPQLALSGFYSNLYDLALLDIKMPQMDGFDPCRRLMKIENRIKVCFLTAADLLLQRNSFGYNKCYRKGLFHLQAC
jgi:DNA-binding response OmpR family regulator